MATATLNQYKAAYPDSTDISVAAESMAEAIGVLSEIKQGEPSLLQKTVTGLAVAIPAPAIAIRTEVVGEGAVAAGCKATPYNISSVKNLDKVWFTAIVGEGFTFSGWYLNDELCSAEESYEATIHYDGGTPTTLVYEARFVVQ